MLSLIADNVAVVDVPIIYLRILGYVSKEPNAFPKSIRWGVEVAA